MMAHRLQVKRSLGLGKRRVDVGADRRGDVHLDRVRLAAQTKEIRKLQDENKEIDETKEWPQ